MEQQSQPTQQAQQAQPTQQAQQAHQEQPAQPTAPSEEDAKKIKWMTKEEIEKMYNNSAVDGAVGTACSSYTYARLPKRDSPWAGEVEYFVQLRRA